MFCLSLVAYTGNLFSRLLGTYFGFFTSELSDNTGDEINVQSKGTPRASLPDQAPLAPGAASADLPTCHRAGGAELGCSILPTCSWGFPPQLPSSPPLLLRLLRASHQQQGH